MGKIEPFVAPKQNHLNFICPQCGETQLEEITVGVTVLNSIKAVCYNEDGINLDWGDSDYEDGRIERFQCEECGFMLEDNDGFLVKNYEGLVAWLKERDIVPCEDCGGLGFFASDRGDREGLYLEIERCDTCMDGRNDNWATTKAHNMAKGCKLLLEEAEFVLAMYEKHPEEALSSAINVQLREAIETVKKLMEEADATSGD